MDLSSVEKTDLLMLLLYSKGQSGKTNEPIVGITRLMKLLFLLKKEQNFNQFEFEAYKMGPFSSEVYPEIDFLHNFPTPENSFVITEKNTKPETNLEDVRISEDIPAEDSFLIKEDTNEPFRLSPLGARVAEELWNNLNEEQRKKIEFVKARYGAMSLRDLLRYVYKTYPDMTVNSEIKDQL